jgi:HAD superfamily hydrolase (TIGR01484 family)
MDHLHKRGYITTISTGRGFVRIKDLLGSQFEQIVSDKALMILEHGTKIVDHNGTIVFGEFLSSEELDHIIDFIRVNIELFKLAWFNPEDISKKLQVWCVEEKDVEEELSDRATYADVFSCSITKLKEILLSHKLTSISLRLKSHIKVENLKLSLTRTDTNLIFQDSNMEFVKNNTNKGLALLYLKAKLGIKTENLLVAGNAINDVEMFNIEAGKKILVGPKETRTNILSYVSNQNEIITVGSPEELGKYLLQL